METSATKILRRSAGAVLASAVPLVWVGAGLAAPLAPLILQPRPLTYEVATFVSTASPQEAGKLATLGLVDWVKDGWTPLNIAADYATQEKEGTTVLSTVSPLWTVHVLLSCLPHPSACKVPPSGP